MARAAKYAGLPERVMGLRCSRHRLDHMKQILKHHKQIVRFRSTKPHLLALLSALEQSLSSTKVAVIREWLTHSKYGGRENFSEWRKNFNQILESDSVKLTEAEEENEAEDEEAEEEPDIFEEPDSHTQEDIVGEKNIEKIRREDTEEGDSVTVKETECHVCMESLPHDDFPQQSLTLSCNHGMTVCTSCIRESIDLQIFERPYEHISCPDCPGMLTFEAIKEVASQEAFALYTEKGFRAAIEKMEGYTKCFSSTCKSGQVHGSGNDQPIMTCVACGYKTCYTHMMPWHTDLTCAQYDEERRLRWGREEEATNRVLAETAKACPNKGCGYFITKDGGCDHMTCKRCRHDFCWLCLASYRRIRREGNSAHQKSCRYHSERLPSYVPLARPQPG